MAARLQLREQLRAVRLVFHVSSMMRALIFGVLASASLGFKCPSPCSCDGTSVDCGGKGLSEVPALDPRTTHLEMENNKVTTLRAGALPRSLVMLGFEKNGLRAVEAGAFKGLAGLKIVYFVHNELVTLPAGVFVDNPELTILLLHHNKLEQLPAATFSALRRLRVCKIFGNAAPPARLKALFSGLDMLQLDTEQDSGDDNEDQLQEQGLLDPEGAGGGGGGGDAEGEEGEEDEERRGDEGEDEL